MNFDKFVGFLISLMRLFGTVGVRPKDNNFNKYVWAIPYIHAKDYYHKYSQSEITKIMRLKSWKASSLLKKIKVKYEL
jgi:hypothetical protein